MAKPSLLLIINLSGVLFALVAATYNYTEHQHFMTSIFFVPFALFGAYMSYLIRDIKPALSYVAAAFVWLCAILV